MNIMLKYMNVIRQCVKEKYLKMSLFENSVKLFAVAFTHITKLLPHTLRKLETCSLTGNRFLYVFTIVRYE